MSTPRASATFAGGAAEPPEKPHITDCGDADFHTWSPGCPGLPVDTVRTEDRDLDLSSRSETTADQVDFESPPLCSPKTGNSSSFLINRSPTKNSASSLLNVPLRNGEPSQTPSIVFRSTELQHPTSSDIPIEDHGRKLLCPYYALHGELGCVGESCRGPRFKQIHRLKEHLERKHGPPIACPRCKVFFQAQEAVDDHLNHDDRCPIRDFSAAVSTKHFTVKQRKSLKARRKLGATDLEEWWRYFKILFPDHDRTSFVSPYFYAGGTGPVFSPHSFEEAFKKVFLFEMQKRLGSLVPDGSDYAMPASRVEGFIKEAFESGAVRAACDSARQGTMRWPAIPAAGAQHSARIERSSGRQENDDGIAPTLITTISPSNMSPFLSAPVSKTTFLPLQSSLEVSTQESTPLTGDYSTIDDFLLPDPWAPFEPVYLRKTFSGDVAASDVVTIGGEEF